MALARISAHSQSTGRGGDSPGRLAGSRLPIQRCHILDELLVHRWSGDVNHVVRVGVLAGEDDALVLLQGPGMANR